MGARTETGRVRCVIRRKAMERYPFIIRISSSVRIFAIFLFFLIPHKCSLRERMSAEKKSARKREQDFQIFFQFTFIRRSIRSTLREINWVIFNVKNGKIDFLENILFYFMGLYVKRLGICCVKGYFKRNRINVTQPPSKSEMRVTIRVQKYPPAINL